MTTAQVETAVAATSTPNETSQTGRGAGGRFARGNAGGPGNPFAREVAALKKEFVKAAKERLPKILDKLFTLAEEGNAAAIKLVLQYTYGKPTEPPNPDRVDADEWQCLKETVGMLDEMPKLLDKPDPIVPLTLVRETRPEVTRSISGRLGAALADPDAFHAAEEKAREEHFRQLEQASLRAAAKYDGFVPDETGLPPEVKPIQPKANGTNGGKARSARVSKPVERAARSAERAESGVSPSALRAPRSTSAGGPPSANRFIEGLPDWCPPIPVSDEPIVETDPPSAISRNGQMRGPRSG